MRKYSLLIVDDNIEYLSATCHFFAASGLFYVQKPVTNGADAIKRFEEAPPDIAILDSVMPGIDGVGVLRKLREKGIAKHTLIFANSPQISDEIVTLLQKLGAVYVIIKPTEPAEMLKRIIDYINAKDGKSTQAANEKSSLPRYDAKRDELIVRYLRMVSIPPHLMGYRYLKRAIEYFVECYGNRTYITKDIYPMVANDFSTTWKCVDRDIRTAIESAWIDGNMEGQHKLFGYTVSSAKGRPTNKELIALITDQVVAGLSHRNAF